MDRYGLRLSVWRSTALTEATGGNNKAVADEGGWASAETVEDTPTRTWPVTPAWRLPCTGCGASHGS